MSSPSFSSIFSALGKDERVASTGGLHDELKAALDQLNSAGVHPNYVADLSRLASLTIGLISTISAPTFQVLPTIGSIQQIHSILNNLESFIRTSQQSYVGFCIVNQQTEKMLPNLFFTKADARAYIETIAATFSRPTLDFSIVEVTYTATRVNQPLLAPPPSLPPPPPPPVPAEAPAPVPVHDAVPEPIPDSISAAKEDAPPVISGSPIPPKPKKA